MKFKVVFIVLWGLIFVNGLSLANEFDLSMQESMAGFDKKDYKEFINYKKSIKSEFEEYKNIINDEFAKYKKKILKNWKRAEVPGKSKWVEYSGDYKTKKTIDYEKGIIEITIIQPENADNEKELFKKNLVQLIRKDSSQAYKNDDFSQRVEERLVESGIDAKEAESIDSVPLIGDVITGSNRPPKKVAVKAADSLIEKGEITESESKIKNSKEVKIRITLPSEYMQRKALAYVDYVKKYSDERKVDPALIFAVIQTESSFNPMARSYIPAYGLMQIVPGSAGIDASMIVFGEKKILAPSYLFNAKNNIEIGTAYLYVLTKRYMRRIKDSTSRVYCAIAAYNTGSVNVAKAFGYNGIQKAVSHINKMTSDDVYKILVSKLPQTETINYLKKVTKRMNHYEKI